MIKAIFFDIDGTLVTKGSKALDSTKKAIQQAQARGILCGVATGRGPVDLAERIDFLPLDMFVTYNGQFVYTKDEVFYQQPFSNAVLTEIVTFADREQRQILFGGEQRIDGSPLMKMSQASWVKKIADFLPKWVPVRRIRKTMQSLSTNRSLHRYAQLSILEEPIYQCVLFSAESETEKLRHVLPNCSFQRSNPYSVDLIPKGGSKFRGIEKFLAKTGIKSEEIMVFGDHLNDLEMLKGAGIGVAMGNGLDAVKAQADYITDTNENDGIYKALRHFEIIEEEL